MGGLWEDRNILYGVTDTERIKQRNFFFFFKSMWKKECREFVPLDFM